MSLSKEDIKQIYNILFEEKKIEGIEIKEMASILEQKYLEKTGNIPPHKGFLIRILECFDKDQNGHVDFFEFVKGLSLFGLEGTKEEKLRFLFNFYDIEKDGIISNRELFFVLQQMCDKKIDEKSLQQAIDKTIRIGDLDEDGCISFKEFKKLITNINQDLAS